MPELPEVETIKNDLKSKVLQKRITAVSVKLARTVKNDAKEFRRALVGNEFADIRRVGKLMIFIMAHGNRLLLVHLKMTGQLIYCVGDDIIAGGHSLPKIRGCLPNKYSRVIFGFIDGSHLFFNDMRTFGFMRLIAAEELPGVESKFGPDPLGRGLGARKLADIFRNRQSNIKAVLLNQQLIAGIGNIYADEILFAAGIRPNRQAGSLKSAELEKLHAAIGRVLRRAVRYRGTTFNDYVDADGNMGSFVKHLAVYGRAGQPCPRCGGTVKKTKVAGRGTHYCPRCQR